MLDVFLVNAFVITVCVFIHFETFRTLIRFLQKLRITGQFKVLFAIFGSLIAHTVEIWLFGVTYYYLLATGEHGSLQGNFDGSLLDCVYFSITTYTSLGFGDVEPSGPIRFTAGFEALAGLALITWSASFIFIEMQRYWLFDSRKET